jgi:hypothetical protein
MSDLDTEEQRNHQAELLRAYEELNGKAPDGAPGAVQVLKVMNLTSRMS